MSDIARRTPVFIACTVLCALGSTSVLADTIGPLTPTGVVNVPLTGNSWSTPASSIGSDDLRSTAMITIPASDTDLLVFTFSPGIPAGATIDGVEVFVEGQSGGSATTPVLFGAASIDAGASYLFAPIPFIFAFPPGPVDSTIPLGTPTDDWLGLTAANLNSGLFRIGFEARDDAQAFTDTYSIDDVTMTVHFTPGSVPMSSSQNIIATAFCLVIAGGFSVWRVRRRVA